VTLIRTALTLVWDWILRVGIAFDRFAGKPLGAQILGVVVGLFTSFLSWWVLFHFLRPKIVLSDVISATEDESALGEADDSSRELCYIKLVNVGWRRAIDLQVTAIARIKGLAASNPGLWKVVRLRVEEGDPDYSYPIINPLRKSRLRWPLRIHVNDIEKFKRSPFPEHIRAKAVARTLRLKDVLEIGTASEVRVVVSCSDGFSGARRVDEQIYARKKLIFAPFKKNSLEIDKPSAAST
jgi:hypothetical protein